MLTHCCSSYWKWGKAPAFFPFFSFLLQPVIITSRPRPLAIFKSTHFCSLPLCEHLAPHQHLTVKPPWRPTGQVTTPATLPPGWPPSCWPLRPPPSLAEVEENWDVIQELKKETAERRALKMIPSVTFLTLSCFLGLTVTAAGAAAGLERIEHCGTRCSQVKKNNNKKELHPLSLKSETGESWNTSILILTFKESNW